MASRRAGDLGGRGAVVIGAGRGIGRRVALTLAERGARVLTAGRDADAVARTREEIEAAGGEGLAASADVTDAGSLAALAETAAAQLGAVDVLVNAAGIAGPTAKLWLIEPAEWEETIRTNLGGMFLACRAFAPTMVARRSGSIVLIGSATGKRPLPGRTPYAAAKAALIGFVRSLAWDLGEAGVRVNLVSPGPVVGERLERVIAAQAAAGAGSVEEVRADLAAGSPLRRLTGEEEVARAVAFLAGDDATAITGEDLNASSGWVTY